MNPSRPMLQSINPATLEMVGQVPVTPPETVAERVASAQAVFPAWRDAGLKTRIAALERARQLLLERSERFGRLITAEMGRPYVESMVMEMEASVDLMGYYCRKAPDFLRDRRVPLHNLFFKRRKSYIHFSPLGVLGVIAPWNWPVLIPLGFIAPGLLAGNAVVFKHSELTPLIAEELRRLFLDAGVPEAVFQTVHGGGDVGAALVDAKTERIFFTGSTEVGQKVMAHAARSLKKAVLELGGSDPAIVCDDADIDNASSGIVWGAFNNCGQNCNSVERVIVDASVADRLIEAVVEKTKRLRIGNGADPGTDVGPLASEAQLQKTEAIVRSATGRGGRVLCGGRRPQGMAGYYFEPTVIQWSRSNPAPADDELFAPVLYVTPSIGDGDAIRLANGSCFGLAASVWTTDRNRGERIGRAVESGTVMVNDVVVSFGIPEAGWTGVKKSGVGWVHGEKGLDEMVNIQYVHSDPQIRLQKFWWFPYSGRMVRGMKAGMTFLFDRRPLRKIAALPEVLRQFTGYLLLNRRRKDKI
jgi:acyl-CoA reductase-like NAD-dependent aldehyde dehydrogenase